MIGVRTREEMKKLGRAKVDRLAMTRVKILRSEREEKSQYDARLNRMREDERHLDRMKHDKQYRLRFLKTEKMKSAVIAEGKAGLASQIAKLNARMRERERERAAEDERVKKMMKTIKRTIQGTLSEFNGEAGESDLDDEEEDEDDEEEVRSRSSAVSSVSGKRVCFILSPPLSPALIW